MSAQFRATFLLRKSLIRRDFIAHVLYVVVAGTATILSFVLQIQFGIFIRDKVRVTPHENQTISCKSNSIICMSYQSNW